MSARLGRDPLLVQATSGNTSVKLDGCLWIKASGKWLAAARDESIFTRVDFADAPAETPSTRHRAAAGLTPSIETAMHATLPQKVILHVHSVNAIAWAVRQDGPEQLTARLANLRWQWIPHVPSGAPLAREIHEVLTRAPGTDVFVLANHGLVVCGESCDSAEALLREVEQRLAIVPRQAPDPDCGKLEQFAGSARLRMPPVKQLHALGTDRVSRSILSGGVLFPCQAIFLAPSLTIIDRSCQTCASADQSFFILEGGGVVISETITQAEYEMLMGLMEVVQRLDDSASIRYLSQTEIRNVLNEDAYRYRALAEATPNRWC